jgi:cytoskeletal protein CcmA (bactofilin family)
MFDKVRKMTTYVGPKSEIVGTVDGGNGDVVVAGRVVGNVKVKAGASAFRGMFKTKNTVYVKGEIDGDITADVVSVDGTVNGTITCSDLELGSSARVNGDVYYTGHLRSKPGARIAGLMVPKDEEPTVDTHSGEVPAPNLDWGFIGKLVTSR